MYLILLFLTNYFKKLINSLIKNPSPSICSYFSKKLITKKKKSKVFSLLSGNVITRHTNTLKNVSVDRFCFKNSINRRVQTKKKSKT